MSANSSESPPLISWDVSCTKDVTWLLWLDEETLGVTEDRTCFALVVSSFFLQLS